MELDLLQTFHAVVQANGLTAAERVLGIKQPAISKALQRLEQQIGVPLMERSRQGVVLTSAGQRLMVTCQNVFAEVGRFSQLTERERPELRGDVKIATHEHVATYLLPRALVELRRQHPGLVPRIFAGPAHLLTEELADGRCELGLFLYAEKSPLLERRELKKVPCQLVVSPKAAHRRDVLTTFIGSREIDDVTNKSFPTLHMLTQHRPETSIKLSCNSLEAHKALVGRGYGVSVLPRFMVERELKDGTLEVLHPEYVYLASLDLVTKRGKVLSRQAKALLKVLRTSLSPEGRGSG
jgi:LysR family transcriptional regulator, nitrogen assimilation regulatory protein